MLRQHIAHRLEPRRPNGQRRRARLFGWALAAALLLAPTAAAAQQVLLAPQVDVRFEKLDADRRDDRLQVAYGLSEQDWEWAGDLGLELWLTAYAPAADGQSWELLRASALDEQSGDLTFGPAVDLAQRPRVGLCLVAASRGGQLAPGMGYVCEKPVELTTSRLPVSLSGDRARLKLRVEREINALPWFSPERGFDTAGIAAGDSEATPANAEEFVSYRAPTPPRQFDAPMDAVRARGASVAPSMRRPDRYGDRFRSPYPPRTYAGFTDFSQVFSSDNFFDGTPYVDDPYYDRDLDAFIGGGFFGGGFFDDAFIIDRNVRFDAFRHRRLAERRLFGPLDVFDAKFDQDMFTTHPEDVFFSFPVTPGYFGRDAFGRDLRGGFGPQDGSRLRPRPSPFHRGRIHGAPKPAGGGPKGAVPAR